MARFLPILEVSPGGFYCIDEVTRILLGHLPDRLAGEAGGCSLSDAGGCCCEYRPICCGVQLAFPSCKGISD